MPDALARAASTAARAVSSSAIGTTIPGKTTGSLTNRTGTDLATAIKPPKLSLMRSILIGAGLFPILVG
ncbi:hypothetical protein I553_6398 [Mycobacterium xenopi 4042]|uniref:Uncharacterized protein n=1 Tax=Mycobacterium xenopi 4042 TaxID=1299334 RepID=X8BH13_MYCXE|nr:hypothetical protein I553_6398 [Mycobacterium xenopi 4042]